MAGIAPQTLVAVVVVALLALMVPVEKVVLLTAILEEVAVEMVVVLPVVIVLEQPDNLAALVAITVALQVVALVG